MTGIIFLIINIVATILNIILAIYLFRLYNSKKYYLPHLYKLNIIIDHTFTLKEKVCIIQALESWEEITHGLVIFDIIEPKAKELLYTKEHYAVNFVKAYSTDEVIQNCDKYEKAKILGYAYKGNLFGMIFNVSDRIKSEDIVRVNAHEIGHILGLPHFDDKVSIMNRLISRKIDGPNRNDLENLINNWK